MAIRPCNAWKMPTMISMMAANRMNPTAQPLVCRPAREDASLLTADPSSALDDRPHHGTCGGGRHYPVWDELCRNEPPLGGPGAVSVGSWHRAQSRSSPYAEEACRLVGRLACLQVRS